MIKRNREGRSVTKGKQLWIEKIGTAIFFLGDVEIKVDDDAKLVIEIKVDSESGEAAAEFDLADLNKITAGNGENKDDESERHSKGLGTVDIYVDADSEEEDYDNESEDDGAPDLASAMDCLILRLNEVGLQPVDQNSDDETLGSMEEAESEDKWEEDSETGEFQLSTGPWIEEGSETPGFQKGGEPQAEEPQQLGRAAWIVQPRNITVDKKDQRRAWTEGCGYFTPVIVKMDPDGGESESVQRELESEDATDDDVEPSQTELKSLRSGDGVTRIVQRPWIR